MRIRRPSHATVVAYLALFLALGGVSYAAVKLPADSVGTKQLRNRAVTLTKIAPAARTALHGAKGATGATGATGPAGPAGPAGSNATLNVATDGSASTPSLRTLGPGAQQALAGNGKAADSNLLDGIDSSGFVQGSGTVQSVAAELNPGDSQTVHTGLSTIVFTCPATVANPGSLSVSHDGAGAAPTWIAHDGATPAFSRVGLTPATTTTSAAGDHVTVELIDQFGTPTHTLLADVFTVNDTTSLVCDVAIHYIVD